MTPGAPDRGRTTGDTGERLVTRPRPFTRPRTFHAQPKPKEADYSLAWELGLEYIDQEGSPTWRALRELGGWTREDVDALCDGMLPPPRQELIEDYNFWPEIDELAMLARIYDTSPGKLLNRVLEEKGNELIAEQERDRAGS